MAKYNLSQGVTTGFDFTIVDPSTEKELTFKMRYPSAADFEPSKALDLEIDDLKAKIAAQDIELAKKKEFQDRIDELENKKAEMFYELIEPVDHEVQIADLLKHLNIVTVKKFNEMITSELGSN